MLSSIDDLILAIASGLYDPTGHDLEIIRHHVANAGYSPSATYPADSRVVGLRRANGNVVSAGDQIPTAELHYLRHVIKQQEWPLGTVQEGYEASLRSLAATLRVGILVSEIVPFGWHVAIIGRSGNARGPRGYEWMLVEYRVSSGHWATGHQLREGFSFAQRRRSRRWLRLPK